MTIVATTWQQSSSATSFGTGAFQLSAITPQNNCLLAVICFAQESTDSGMTAADLTISDTLAKTWTQRASVTPAGFGSAVAIWTTPIELGQSMQISVDAGARSVFCYRVEVVCIKGYDEASPVGGSGNATDADGQGSLTFNLSQTPRGDSYTLVAALTNGTTGLTGAIAGDGNITSNSTGTITDHFHWFRGLKSGAIDVIDITFSDMNTGSNSNGAGACAVEIRHKRSGNAPLFLYRF